jgi:hypothetical protein
LARLSDGGLWLVGHLNLPPVPRPAEGALGAAGKDSISASNGDHVQQPHAVDQGDHIRAVGAGQDLLDPVADV